MKKHVKKEYIITTMLIIAFWYILANLVNNDVLIPYPFITLKEVILILFDLSFYDSLIATLLHVFSACFYSLIIALLLAISGYEFKTIRYFFEPLNMIIKTIPNISYIIIILIWFGSTKSVSIICFLILFPMIYSNILYSLDNINKQYHDVELIYHENFIDSLRYHLIPYLLPLILNNLKTSFSLGFKVGVMAEILGQAPKGIGRLLQIAKLNLNMTHIFAYTIIIIMICLLIDIIFNNLIHFYEKRR